MTMPMFESASNRSSFALADAIAVLCVGGSFHDAEELSGIPAGEIRRHWDLTTPEEGDRATPAALEFRSAA